MNVFIIFCHPSYNSFTKLVMNEFVKGLIESGHRYKVSDLYKMNFITDISEDEYTRESNYESEKSIPNDVIIEQEKINRSDVIVFIYPVFWTEAPAKLVGWFDRVWTYGFAYGDRKMKKLKKAIVLCVTGHTLEHLKEFGHYDSMKTVMIGDRIFDRAKYTDFIVFDGMSKHNNKLRELNMKKHLKKAYDYGKNI